MCVGKWVVHIHPDWFHGGDETKLDPITGRSTAEGLKYSFDVLQEGAFPGSYLQVLETLLVIVKAMQWEVVTPLILVPL